ncbi:MAG TPA: AAA family ATPase [Candidatus Angelobacter sp.]|nr:AAA family ATPase [Candidatus Angelobacter sp.]
MLQLAAAAYQAANSQRHYISSFILAGSLDIKPFRDDASVEYTYAEPPASDGKQRDRTLTVSRSGSSWSGYDRQPNRNVLYLGSGFYWPQSERDPLFKALFGDSTFLPRIRRQIEDSVVGWASTILLCKYSLAHQNEMRKKYARRSTRLISAKREGGLEYSEANMGFGEARLYSLITALESLREKSLVLMEEPETALHPCAQYELGKYLMDVALRRKLQVLLTTHSEYLLLALPQNSRVYFKRDNTGVVPIHGIGVRQAVSMMEGLAAPAIYILVEDDLGEAIVMELLRKHDPDFLKTSRVIVAGDKDQISRVMSVFEDQKIPICAIRDGDFGANAKLKMFKLFGAGPPEKEIFACQVFRKHFAEQLGVDWDAADLVNKTKNHHAWFDILEVQTARKRAELLPLAARAYLEGVSELERQTLVEQIKASVP